MAYGAGRELLQCASHYLAAESARPHARLEKLKQRRARLPEQPDERSAPQPTEELTPR
jgi:hypothetical protein